MTAFTRGELFVAGLMAFLLLVVVALVVVDQIDYAKFNAGCQSRGGFTVRASDGHRRCVSEVGK